MNHHTYTSTDKDGIRWRWDGMRPVSEIADKVMDDLSRKMRQVAWLLTRPKPVQELAKIYPPRTKFQIHDRVMYTVGYTESYEDGTASLLLSATDPDEDYAKAADSREPVCRCCLPKLKELLIP